MYVQDVKAFYYSVMRMAGKLIISKDSQPFQHHLDNKLVMGIQEDGWKQTLGKIIFGDGVPSYCYPTKGIGTRLYHRKNNYSA